MSAVTSTTATTTTIATKMGIGMVNLKRPGFVLISE
jgi:hypothetical protein